MLTVYHLRTLPGYNILMYAKDTQLYYSIDPDDISRALLVLNNDLDSIQDVNLKSFKGLYVLN